MIRLSWRQLRAQAVVAAALLLAVMVAFAVTRPHIVHLYAVAAAARAACTDGGDCRNVIVDIGTFDNLLKLVGTALVVVPALVGAFWGAPLVARELETGTHRLAWTQSVTRDRWLATKLAVVGVASVATTALLSLLVTWWSSPLDADSGNRFGSGLFGERNIVPLGYAAFAFVLGVVLGLLIRRTLPAMAATLFTFLAARLAFTYWVRPHLLSPLHLTAALDPSRTGFGSRNGAAPTLQPGAPPHLGGAWVYSVDVVDRGGHALTAPALAHACPQLSRLAAGPPPAVGRAVGSGGHAVRLRAPQGVQDTLTQCLHTVGASYHEYVTYQPANRYWPMQWLETGCFLAAAVALAALCFWLLRRRAA